jgi:hypothetical protein
VPDSIMIGTLAAESISRQDVARVLETNGAASNP